jgi:hypothetical protein
MPNDLRTVLVICPECQTEVQILAEGVPPGTDVTCSRCGFDLGLWDDLVDGTTTPTRAPTSGEEALGWAAGPAESGPAAMLGDPPGKAFGRS